MSTQNNPNRIDPTSSPVRQSTNLSVERQTPKTDFGDRVKYGLESAAGAVAQGAAIAAPFVPGGAIVSAAVSSVTQLSSAGAGGGGGGGGGVTGQYSQGVATVGGGTINTTVGAGGGSTPTFTGGAGVAAGGGGQLGQVNTDLMRSQQENMELMKLQISMQRENQVFSTVSNVLKTRHDTVKNTISNVR